MEEKGMAVLEEKGEGGMAVLEEKGEGVPEFRGCSEVYEHQPGRTAVAAFVTGMGSPSFEQYRVRKDAAVARGAAEPPETTRAISSQPEGQKGKDACQ